MSENSNFVVQKYWFSTKEIVELKLKGMPTERKNVITKLVKSLDKGGKRRPLKARGGGYEYHISSLPLKARIDLDQRRGIKVEKGLKVTMPEVKNNSDSQIKFTQTLNKAKQFNHEASKKAVMIAKGREAIINKIEGLKTSNTTYTEIINHFVEAYNRGDFKQEYDKEDIYNYIPSLSYRSVLRFMKSYKEEGLAGLLPNLEAKRPIKLDKVEYKSYIVASITQYPHVSNLILFQIFEQKYQGVTGYRNFCRYVSKYKKEHAQELMLMTNPDKWRGKYQLAVGKADEYIVRLNQEWQIDSTIADIMLADNKRYNIVGIIDVYSRRAVLHVSETSSSEAVLACLSKALNAFGKPEVLKTDNGKDYVSIRVKDSLHALGIRQEICPPFSPEKKPFIERFFKTFSHNLLTLYEGYVGHSVEARKAIESRKSFAARLFRKEEKVDLRLSREELQSFCDNWLSNYYHVTKHRSLGVSPLEQAATYKGDVYRYQSMEALAILMAPRSGDGVRTVTKEGIYVDGGRYFHQYLALHIGKKVKVLFAEEDWGKAYVFTLKGEFIAVAKDYEREGYSRQELAMAIKGKQKQLKAITNKAYKEMLKDATRQPELIKAMFESRKESKDEFIEEYLEDRDKQAKVAETFNTIEAEIALKVNKDTTYELAIDNKLQEREKRWERYLELQQRLDKGEELTGEEQRFLDNYKTTEQYKSKKFMSENFDKQGKVIINEQKEY